MKEIKYCEDCKWFSHLCLRCKNPNAKQCGDGLIYRDILTYAGLERDQGNCGPEGKMFEKQED